MIPTLVDIRYVCRMFDMRLIFTSEQTNHLDVDQVEDALPSQTIQVVYWILSSCSNIYIGEISQRVNSWVKEH